MKLLAFSDVHRDLDAVRSIVERAPQADVVIAAGDFASVHKGLEETIAPLRAIERPTLLVPGNNETDQALRAACAGWESAVVLHGAGAELDGVPFYGLGAGVPTTPWDWSFDLTEEEAAEQLADLPHDAVLVVHSPPYGHVDGHDKHLGSRSILGAIEDKQPLVAVCGHVHECWGEDSKVGDTRVLNLGPSGTEIEI